LERAREFAKITGTQTIVKSSGGREYEYGTRFFEDLIDEKPGFFLDQPLIFQDYLDAESEYRVIYICGEIYGGQFDLRGLQNCADIRLVGSIVPRRAVIPEYVQEMIRKYCAATGLKYAAFDIQKKEGNFYFLEANTCGEWLYIDECNDWEISKAVARSLSIL
jgi:glutathione synthase/RimK-type ligase-like ATP-grasp enzyme